MTPTTSRSKIQYPSSPLVSTGGLREPVQWIPVLQLYKEPLMRMWRYAVVTYLRAAQAAGSLISDSSENDLKQLFIREYQRPFWIIRISRSMPKWHFLQYAARYARRPAIAQGRILEFNAVSVQFLTKNRKAKFVVPIGRFVGDLLSMCRIVTGTEFGTLVCGHPARRRMSWLPYLQYWASINALVRNGWVGASPGDILLVLIH
jgi:Putative transposase